MPKGSGGGLVLNGLDGSNPLGFLAAVGTLRTVASVESEANWRMKWVALDGSWFPVLSATGAVSRRELIELLFASLRRDATPEFEFAKNLNVTPAEFGKVARNAQCRASNGDRRYADFVASFGCELFMARNGKSIQDTDLRTMSGTGHQHFLGTMRQLVVQTEAGDLLRSLFEIWDYADDKLGLRWDPEEDRRYALRWDNPSGDATKTMRGANRLAVEALPLLPTVPGNLGLETTGLSRVDKAVLFTWPIWEGALSLEVVRSLLAFHEFQKADPDGARLHAIGVVAAYRSQRITIGKFRNFTQSHPV